jgi:hypothetical protein
MKGRDETRRALSGVSRTYFRDLTPLYVAFSSPSAVIVYVHGIDTLKRRHDEGLHFFVGIVS